MKSDEDYFSRNMTYFNVFYVWGKNTRILPYFITGLNVRNNYGKECNKYHDECRPHDHFRPNSLEPVSMDKTLSVWVGRTASATQTYGYLPSHTASLPCQPATATNCLIGDRGTRTVCEQLAQSRYIWQRNGVHSKPRRLQTNYRLPNKPSFVLPLLKKFIADW